MRLGKKVVGFLLMAGFSLLFFLNLCDLLFQCGCRSWWDGADRFCNIHMAEAVHCPWCSFGWWGSILPRAAIVFVQAGLAFAPSRLSWHSRLILGLVCFPVVGAILGLLFAVISDYPVFLFFRLS